MIAVQGQYYEFILMAKFDILSFPFQNHGPTTSELQLYIFSSDTGSVGSYSYLSCNPSQPPR
jgi:hypothetical protein